MNKTQGVELEIRKDDGNTIMVVQKQGSTPFSVGQRVPLPAAAARSPSLLDNTTMRPVAPHRIFQPRLFRRNKFVLAIRHIYFNIPSIIAPAQYLICRPHYSQERKLLVTQRRCCCFYSGILPMPKHVHHVVKRLIIYIFICLLAGFGISG
jgi:hypothetical protein